jgi:hypothetical protein
VSLQSGLNLLLRPLDLTWTIQDEVLLITTPEEAELALIVKVYDVHDLVRCRDKSGEEWADYDTLIEVIKTTVKPETWDDVGGAGSVAPAPFRGVEMLVISQIYEVHQKIERLLEQFRAIAEESGTGEIPVREKPKPRPKTMGFSEAAAPDAGGGGGWSEAAAPEESTPDARDEADSLEDAAPDAGGGADVPEESTPDAYERSPTPDAAGADQPADAAPSGGPSAVDATEFATPR